ncbi:MAG: hypothetical protein F4Y86_05100 [Gammaproteobacteria bacterium]|nr:hypothetical protein [Gammaproteobacteria bacterium]
MSGDAPRVDLRPDHLEIVRDVLRRYSPTRRVVAFGSRATWTGKEYSDLDLAVLGDKPLPLDVMTGLVEGFRESDLPFKVDVVEWADANDRLRNAIRRDGVEVQPDVDIGSGLGPSTRFHRAYHTWPRVPLDRLIDLRLSGVDKKSKPAETPVKLCNYTDVYYNSVIRQDMTFMEATASDREIAKCTLLPGDVVITKDSEQWDDIGVPAFVADRVPRLVCGYHLAILRPDVSRLNGRYLSYALSARDSQHQFHHYANGITRFGLRKADIGLVEVPLPSLPDQTAIAHILGTLDDKIELNRRMNETLEEMARALFKSWFVDFDPVRAKMEARDTGLPRHLAGVFPSSFDNERNPTGWKLKSISEFTRVVYGAPFASDQFTTDNIGVPLIRIRDLATHEPGLTTEQVHQKGHLIRPGDIVVGMDGEFRLHIWKGPKAWLNQRVCHFEPNHGVPRAFIAEALRTPLEFFERGKVGTTVIHLGKSDIDTIEILHPGSPLLRAFADIAEPILDQSVKNALQGRTLAQIRDVLLPKLISGELRVSDAEKIVEAAT